MDLKGRPRSALGLSSKEIMFNLTEDQSAIVEGAAAACSRFDDAYWAACDQDARFPSEFHRTMAEGGWLGVTMPAEYGGGGLGIKEAALVMHTVASHGGGMAATSSIHMNMFGPHPIVVHGTTEQKDRWIPPLISGEDQVCFGVTEPDAGLDTTSISTFARRVAGGYSVSGRKIWTSTAQVANKIVLLARTSRKPARDQGKATEGMSLFYTDLDRAKVEVRRIPKHGRAAVDSNSLFIDELFVPEEDLVGEDRPRLLLPARRVEPRASPHSRRGCRHRSGRPAKGHGVRGRTGRVCSAHRDEPRHPASACRVLDLA